MEYEPGEYNKLVIRRRAPTCTDETNEGKYWRRFKAPIIAKQFGAVSHLDFCQQYPYNLAVTASTRVVIYNGRTRQVARTVNRFKDIAYSGNFRSDGKLLVAGSQTGVVQVFDASSRTVLRQFKDHQRPTHVAHFAPDRLHVLSGSDDVTVRYWDITSGAQVHRFNGHTDYVRSAAVSPASEDTWATGGYDHICKLWDVRTQSAVMNLDHGAPIEDLKILPSGSMAVTAGGSHLCIWDLVGGGRLVKKIGSFQKTVSSVCISPAIGLRGESAAPRLLAGSLDGHVKVFDLDFFRVTHVSKYPAPVLSVAVSPDASMLAVGLADSTLSIRKHQNPLSAAAAAGGFPIASGKKKIRWQPKLNASNYQYFIRGQGAKAGVEDFQVEKQRSVRLQAYDKLLRQFRYRAALDAALTTQNKDVVYSLLEELIVRGGLPGALGGRDAGALLPVLRFLAKSIADPSQTRLLTTVLHAVLDQYGSVVGTSAAVDRELAVIRARTGEELGTLSELAKLAGALEPLLAVSLGACA